MKGKKILIAVIICALTLIMVLTLAACDNDVNNERKYTVTLTCDETQGSVTGGGEYENGTDVTIIAIEKPGFIFSAWYEGETLLSEKAEFVYKVSDKDVTITAKFKADPNFNNFVLTLLNDGTYRIDSIINKSIAEITIPNYVSSIAERAFINCGNISELIVPNSIKHIGNGAFYNCVSLTRITLPFVGEELEGAEHTYFGHIFGADKADNNLLVVPSSLKRVVIKGGSSIDEFAFKGCGNLTDIVIPDNTESIGKGAFYGCVSLTDFTIPNSLTAIKDNTFMLCESLKSVKIPDGVTKIGWYAFADCRSLESVLLNNVKIIGKNAFNGCISITSMIIPGSVVEIESDAFSGCAALAEIYNLSNLNITAGTANNGCVALYAGAIHSSMSEESNLTETNGMILLNAGNKITLVKYIGDAAAVNIPDAASKIGAYAFYNRKNLESVTIPTSVKSIGVKAFYGCNALTNITLPFIGAESGRADNTHLGYLFGADTYADNGKYVPSTLENINIIGGENIGAKAFSNCKSLKTITIPASVKNIGDYAFYNCKNISEVRYNGDIGKWCAISGLSQLMATNGNKKLFIAGNEITGSIVIPDGVTDVNAYAFARCSGITSVTIPNSVTAIGEDAFIDCVNLTSITLPFVGARLNGDSNSHFGYIFGALRADTNGSYVPKSLRNVTITGGNAINSNAFVDCNYLTNITIPDGITVIGENAFKNCSGLTRMTVPGSVTNIGYSAFANCSKLTDITLPFVGTNLSGTVNTYFGYIFGAADINKNGAAVPKTLSNVIITGGTAIGEDAFRNCGYIKSVNLPNSVENINANAFELCENLTSVKLPNNLKNIGSGAFDRCKSLAQISIPISVKSIGESAFSSCINLTSVIIPNNVTTIGYYAFGNCKNLSSIKIGERVTSIGNSAFSNCINISSVVIPDSVTTIGAQTFSECEKLTRVTIGNGVTDIGEYAFQSCGNLSEVTIGKNVANIGQGAFFLDSGISVIRYNGNLTQWCAINGIENLMIFGRKEKLYIDGKEITDLVIPADVTDIRPYAFSGCLGIKSVTKGNSVTSIGEYAFEDCQFIISANIGTGVTGIGKSAFNNCYNLESITIPDNVTDIGVSVFKNCYKLSSAVIGNGITNISEDAFRACKKLASVTLGNNVNSIGDYAFYDCYTLTNVSLPGSVTNIGINAFEYCTGLTAVTFENASNWYAAVKASDIQGQAMIVTDPAENALNLTKTYAAYYWKRS